ncbi:MAG: TfuA-like protein [Candidatus Baltobacteraceae bacterium]
MALEKRRLGVFCGPSLHEEDRIAIRDVTYLAPASRGDVERYVQEFDALLMIDGVFHHDLAPSPKEVYAACKTAKMFGGCSMGALRAAECWPYGMIPLGIIARWYISEVIDGDDEVALLVHPQKQTALTVPLVNVRYVARVAGRRRVLDAEEARKLISDARRVFYMDRTWEDVYPLVPAHARQALREIAELEGDLKRWDARFCLKSALRHLGLVKS